LAGVDAAGVTAGEEVAAATTPALEPAAADVAVGPDPVAAVDAEAPEDAKATTAGADADCPADRLDAVHPAVTRTDTSTSAAAIRRIPSSSRILRRRGPV
jgi:hypothetical protein